MNGIMGKIREELRNPVAWIFLALFVFAEYLNFQKGEDIDKLCELTGPHKQRLVTREQIEISSTPSA